MVLICAISDLRRNVDEIWDITQRRMIILYRRFGSTHLSHFQGSRIPRWNRSSFM